MAERKGLHLFAVDRKEVMAEREKMLRTMAREFGTSPTIIPIFSPSDEENRVSALSAMPKSSVRVRIEALPNNYKNGHVIALITHVGLKIADTSAFGGWKLWVDETPEILSLDEVESPASAAFFAQHYDLLPPDGKWSEIVLKNGRANAATIAKDQFFASLRTFHRRVAAENTKVFCDLKDWSEMEQQGRRWSHWSLWLPEELDAFDQIYFLANGFTQSVTYSLFQSLSPDIIWKPVKIPTRAKFRRRNMQINYFAEGHYGRRNLWDSEIGKGYLKKIARHIDKQVSNGDHIWTCNQRDEKQFSRMRGLKLSPKQTGTNRYDQISTATMIYSAKPSDEMRLVFGALGVPPETVIRCWEYETILQFMCRTSLRDPRRYKDITLYVYDRAQAEYLKNYFDASRYVNAELNLIDLGFAHESVNSKRGPKKKAQPTASELEQAKAKRREKDRAYRRRRRRELKQEAAERGDLPKPRGRPRTVSQQQELPSASCPENDK